jgi:protoporphyrinogen oxidase
MDLLRFSPLPLLSRVRLGASTILMKRIADYHTIEGESALSFLRRYTGAAACEIIWKPLLQMKFGEESDKISAAWIWNRITDRRKSAKGVQGERLGYLRGGLQRICDATADSIRRRGGVIETGAGVERLLFENGACTGAVSGGREIRADAVLTTLPNRVLLSLVPQLPADYAASLRDISYQGSLCCVLSLRRRLSDYYWINIASRDMPFVALIEHTNFMPPEDYGGRHLVYLGKYLGNDDPLFAEPEASISARFARELVRIFPQFDPERDVEQAWVWRAPFTQPVFTVNYSRKMPAVKTPVPGLFLANTTQIYPESRALNSSVLLAQRATEAIDGPAAGS